MDSVWCDGGRWNGVVAVMGDGRYLFFWWLSACARLVGMGVEFSSVLTCLRGRGRVG